MDENISPNGGKPTRYLKRIGAVNGGCWRGTIHLTTDDIEILAEKRGDCALHRQQHESGKGVARWRRRRAGVRFGLGAGGPSSGNTLSL
ncbi:MAG: hypothetical protein ACLVJB_07285 [Christensenellales bacterium]